MDALRFDIERAISEAVARGLDQDDISRVLIDISEGETAKAISRPF